MLRKARRSVDTLIANLNESDQVLGYHIIRALNHIRTRFPDLKFDDRQIVRRILNEAKDYLNILAVLYRQMTQYREESTVEEERNLERIQVARNDLVKALETQLDQNLERIFRLLGLKYPPTISITSTKESAAASPICAQML